MSHSIIPDALETLVSNDPARITAVFTEDAEWLSPPGNAVSVALAAPHHMVGARAIARFLTADLPRLFARDLDVSFHGARADGGRGTAEVTVTGDARQRPYVQRRSLLRLRLPRRPGPPRPRVHGHGPRPPRGLRRAAHALILRARFPGGNFRRGSWCSASPSHRAGGIPGPRGRT